MDEPFGAVDPLNRANLQNEFLKIQKQLKKTVIFVTHDIDEAMKMGDKIAIMSKGILRNFASPEDTLLSDDEFVKSFLGSETYIKILSRFRVKEHMRPQNGADIPYHADCEANLRDVLAQMIEYGTDSMHVTEKGKITGTILLSDILNLFQKGRKGE
jgi:osmoprotectant transport system ATP-binding protein